MRPMSFEQLLNWTLTEYKENGTVFGERHPYHADSKFNRTIFGAILRHQSDRQQVQTLS
jgi:putative selenate reductase